MELLEQARSSISDFCMNECKALCCRKGYLIVKPDQFDLVANKKKIKFKKLEDSSCSINIGKTPCPSLDKDFRCVIHNDKNRPDACKNSPLFLHNKTIIPVPFCPAIKKGLLDTYLKKLESLRNKENQELLEEFYRYRQSLDHKSDPRYTDAFDLP